MRIDPYFLYLICQDYDGFHYSKGPNNLLTAFIGTPTYGLVWTSQWQPTSTSTIALFLPRRSNTFSQFNDVLEVFKNLAHTPCLLAYVSMVHTLQFFDEETKMREYARIRLVEDSTGYGPNPPKAVRRFSVSELTLWSQTTGEIQGNIYNKLRHHKTSRTLLDFVSDECQLLDIEVDDCHPQCRDNMRRLAETIPVLKRQMDASEAYLQYLRDRAEKLSSVLIALLGHEDAEINLEIAVSMKNDSASMKTVAIMTMAFLPATFFAALFAVPSLQWDHDDVVQSNFWIYWAFTLPTTAVVFLVWLVVTNHNRIFNRWAKWLFLNTRRKV
ncbi:uncharacterized protein N7483_003104 [Penicillium malachiteum]|uniref:uncharacterized protein n=1 Tax=Penicillium malachiteum TaxID=1324776 RepID=UPI0025493590|nr:uncharacterized protein N7483_003104 [Penicillium malachiteum]KAJ5728596.1 hypothetical protein N7483_003104 [Penicillium malachiteum]